MSRDYAGAFMRDLVRTYTPETHGQKWEIWIDGRRRTRTLCVRLWLGSAELTLAHRGVGSDGHMREFDSVSCSLEYLPQLVRCLDRALAVATERGLIKQKYPKR